MCQSYIDVENEWTSSGIDVKNILLYLIFRYGFPNLPHPAYLDPPFIRFSENFPSPYYLDPRLLSTNNCIIPRYFKSHCKWSGPNYSTNIIYNENTGVGIPFWDWITNARDTCNMDFSRGRQNFLSWSAIVHMMSKSDLQIYWTDCFKLGIVLVCIESFA